MALVLATPHPDLDIHALFAYYNSIYFDDILSSCFVEWSSPCLTSCLATCNYLKGSCQITLSKPLLQCLSTDHVKNTLLHEMIHAYLFVTKNYRHHSSHGPDFRRIMDSINFSTKVDNQRPPVGYNIMLFHDFHDEDVVDDDIAYVWMCKKCGNTIKRATATQPLYADCIIQAHHSSKTCGLADCRWHRHKVECGGIYTKIQKPEEHLDRKKAVSKGSIRLLDKESHENVIPEPEKGKSVTTSTKEELFPSSAKDNLSATSHFITYRRNLRGTTRSKLAPSGINIKTDLQGKLSDQKSPEANMPDKKGKSVTELNKDTMRFIPSSANSHKISKSRTPNNEVRQAKQGQFSPNAEEPYKTRKLGVQIDKTPDSRGQLIGQKSPEASMLDKKGKSVRELNKKPTRSLPSSANSHKISKSRTPKTEFPEAKQGHFSPNFEEPLRTRKLGVQINKTPDPRGHLIDQKSPEANMPDKKGKSITELNKGTMRSLPSSTNSHKISKSRTPKNEVPQARQGHFSPNAEEPFRTMKLGAQINKTPDSRASEKSKALEKKVKTKEQTTRKSPRFFPSEDSPRTSSMKVAPNRKPELSSPNMFESCRKRKRASNEFLYREYKVVSKWLKYYEDGSTDEEIEPLVNRKIIRARRMKILRESIQREKEEKERKLKEETGGNLLCLPGFSKYEIFDISDDSSS